MSFGFAGISEIVLLQFSDFLLSRQREAIQRETNETKAIQQKKSWQFFMLANEEEDDETFMNSFSGENSFRTFIWIYLN